jgi:hypothetical protein
MEYEKHWRQRLSVAIIIVWVSDGGGGGGAGDRSGRNGDTPEEISTHSLG